MRRVADIGGNDGLLFRDDARAGTWAGLLRDITRKGLSEQDNNRLFLWVPVCFATGIGIYFARATEPAAATVTAALLAAIAAKFFISNKLAGTLLVSAALCVAFGFADAKLRTEMVRSPQLTHKTRPVSITGWVAEAERRQPSGQRVTLRIITIEKLSPEHTPARVRVTLAGRDADLRVGEAITLRAVLQPPPEPVMPGGFNFARRDWFRQIGAVGYAVSKPERVLNPEPMPLSLHVLAVIDRVRQAVSRRILSALPERTGAVANALITGQRRSIDAAVTEALRRSGLAHILAISGLHMALIAGTLFWAVRALLATNPHMALRFPIKKIAAIAALIGGGLYLTLSGAAISTQRAYIMIAIMFLAVCLDRPAISQRNVALAALAVLIPRPESLLHVGFQMSFAAVIALVAIYENPKTRLDQFGQHSIGQGKVRKASVYFFRIALTTLVASIAVAPFAVFHFHQLTHYGLLANLAAMPIVGIVIMPAALLSLLAMGFGLEAGPLWIMALGIEHLLTIAETVSQWPGAVTAVPTIPVSALIMMTFGGLWICLWQSPIRFLGLLGIAVGFLLAPTSEKPDILIDGRAKLVAVRTPGGELAMLPGSRSSFSLRVWLKSDGDTRPVKEARKSKAIRCDTFGCVAKVKGKTLAIVSHPHALAEDCARSDIVISRLRATTIEARKECSGAALFIGAETLRRDGAHAIYINGDDIRTRTVAQDLGNRPWVRLRRSRRNAKSNSRRNHTRAKSSETSINSGASNRQAVPGS